MTADAETAAQAAQPASPHAPATNGDSHAAAASEGVERPRSPHGVQFVKFSFFRLRDEVRGGSQEERADLGRELVRLLERSGDRMITRAYSTIGTRADTDFLIWQVQDDLDEITNWHADLLRGPLGAALDRPHSFLSMTMRSQYENPLHDGAPKRDRIRQDGGVNDYLFVYPMAKTRDWYKLPPEERQRIMSQHIEIGHRYHGIKINTTYSFGLDDQEFVVAFEGDEPGEFLALVRELRDSESSSYTLFDTPMFTCRLMAPRDLVSHLGLV